MRWVLAAVVLAVFACRPDNRLQDAPTGADSRVQDAPLPPDSCSGLACQVTPCEAQGRPTTTISGTVFAPNGALPLFGVTVYVPNVDPGPLPDGVQCTTCLQELPGKPITKTVTDELGRFTLEDVPTGTDIPLVITIGKWRRQLVVPMVTECADTPVDPTLTRLPRNKTEGDIPKIAMVTGGCDALECLLRKLGIEDSEFTADSGTGRIHMYAGGGSSRLADGTTFATATSLWSNLAKLKQYDIGLFSCECGENASTKPLASMNNIKAYADAGGRLFLSHYHYLWIVGNGPSQSPPVWPAVATCNSSGFKDGNTVIDEVNNKKGKSFSLWMQYAMGSQYPGIIPVLEGRQSCSAVDNTRAERWVYFPDGGTEYPMNFQFTTPNELGVGSRCGKVVFSDMHVASGSDSATTFPTGCLNQDMTPQEKALAFMFFDIAACVGDIIQ